ncbi:hypothetical protein ACFQAT_28640 [Undibacterium arcticum]|uniref:Uncharacterized protein n=1 Tax=Undibacterium arcticum TaxID=1762892 RepID=A0ABV7F9G9_9BURK
MNSRSRIAFSKLSTLAARKNVCSRCTATIAVIPNYGCRLFVDFGGRLYDVRAENDEPYVFPTVDMAIIELSKIRGLDQWVTVDMVSLIPRPTISMEGVRELENAA